MKNIKEYFQSVKFSLGYAFRFVPKITVIIGLFFAITSVVPYGSSYVLGKLVDTIVSGIENGVYTNVVFLLFLYSGANVLPHILSNIRRYLVRQWRLRFSMETELSILASRERVDIANYENPSFQDLMQRSFRSGMAPIYNLTEGQFNFLWDLVSFIVGTFLVLQFNYVVYLIVIASAIPTFFIDIKFAGRGWSIWAKDSPSHRRLGDLRQHFIGKNYLVETKLLQSKTKLFNWMRSIYLDFNSKQTNNERSRVWIASIGDILAFLGMTGGLYIVVRGVIDGQSQVGSIVYMLGVLTRVTQSINNLFVDISVQYEDALIVGDIKKVVETSPIIIEPKNPEKLSLLSAPEIAFENVSFKYQNSDKWSLRNVNLTFKAGDNIGLVGNNGAGKTTLVKLLCRIYDPTEGRILVNGVDLKDVSTTEWWSYLAVMFQDYASYDFKVEDAIAIGRPDKPSNLTKVVEAGKISQSHEFIMDWEGKYDQQLGVEFGGKEPSKGQRQKLSIAKVLYRDGFVMVLDEPTASVDAESESKIFDSIESLPKDRTAILISHDFSTISACDKIFVLDNGKLIEDGNHKELMKQKGKYAELYNLQAKRFKK
ncbi:MAG: ABC transporter ATP-binding protein [Minisyncoccia bacterium]